MSSLVANLSMGEAKGRVPGSEMGLIAKPVARLLGWGAVVAQPIGLDHELQLRPEEVDAKAVDDQVVTGMPMWRVT